MIKLTLLHRSAEQFSVRLIVRGSLIMNQESLQSKCWHNPASIKTEVTYIGSKSVVKATIIIGGMIITSFSDEIQECLAHPMSEYKHQAVERAMHLVPQY
jgi:hypothetical protein